MEMQPIEEYGKGKGMKYGSPDPETGQTYYGRGFVQTTPIQSAVLPYALQGRDVIGCAETGTDIRVSEPVSEPSALTLIRRKSSPVTGSLY